MVTLKERKNRLLLKIYQNDADRIIERVKAEVARGDARSAAAIALYSLIPAVKKYVRTKNELNKIRYKQAPQKRKAGSAQAPAGVIMRL